MKDDIKTYVLTHPHATVDDIRDKFGHNGNYAGLQIYYSIDEIIGEMLKSGNLKLIVPEKEGIEK